MARVMNGDVENYKRSGFCSCAMGSAAVNQAMAPATSPCWKQALPLAFAASTPASVGSTSGPPATWGGGANFFTGSGAVTGDAGFGGSGAGFGAAFGDTF